MQFALFFLCLYLVTNYVYSALTENQINAAKKLVRNNCQNKAKATDEQLDAMQKGDFSTEKNVQLRKDNTFDWETGLKGVASNAPPHLAVNAAESIKNCKDAVKTTDDKCTASYEIAKCIYDYNPAHYFLP